jgi:hypothetical protein
VTENGKLLTASTPSAVVIAGTDSSCIAANKGLSLPPIREKEADEEGAGQNTLSIISYASALNSSYIYVPYVLSFIFLPPTETRSQSHDPRLLPLPPTRRCVPLSLSSTPSH